MEAATQTPKAADAKKAEKAAKERARRARIKALETAELNPKTDLNPEQRQRAENAPAGLRKKALAAFILEGKGSKEQAAEGRKERKVEDKVEKAKRSKDPEAAELAARTQARAEAAGLRSSFLPKDARAFLNLLKERKTLAPDLLLGALPPAEENGPDRDLDVAALSSFADKNVKDKEIRAFLKDLGAGTVLWGRKLGLFILARMEEEGS